ncbi:bactericidal permeability-increasing protein-like isoform X2 [Hyperolius riggenbachi]|uniref:bactericidal permeability-increasing protein-like isoform X2 n=1 Tax=Hyperolius riggenbachi TaxID=752182 RepID=UPI0035A2C1CD
MPVDFTPSTLDWLTNFFQQTTLPTLRGDLQKLICEQVTIVVKDQLQPFLHTLPVTENLDNVAAINYSLTSPPNLVGNFMDVKMKGEVFHLEHPSTPPFSPQPVSLPNDYKLMIYIAISDYLFSTAGFAYQYAGKLVFNITDNMIPQGAAVRLNTSSFAIIIPQLKTKYPNLPMKLMVTSPSAPFVNIIQKNVSMALELDIQVFAILPNSSLAPLFLLKLFSMVFIKTEVISDRIVGTMDPTRVHIELERSYIGPFSIS